MHSPTSVEQYFGDSQQDATWAQYIRALAQLPGDIKAVGINDYFSVDGYKRVLQAKKDGLLPNLELILPVIELRLTALVGSRELQKINYHVVFSNEIAPSEIDEFFLRQLNVELKLDDGPTWRGCIGTRGGLIKLGEAVKHATPATIRSSHSPLEVGFANAAIELEKVLAALSQSVFHGRVLTALGVGEWDQMRWDGAGAAHKRDVIGRVDFVLTAAPTLSQYNARRRRLTSDEVNDCLIHASDAHYYADAKEPNRLGQTQTWIKADLSFQGLRRALRRFEDRVFIGSVPPKLQRARENTARYIDSFKVYKRDGSALKETWFDAEIKLNHDLVAIIGNQGSGKSALTDILALCGQTKVENFSFLTPDKFKDKQRRATEFVATVTWANGEVVQMRLSDDVPSANAERVRYIPQGFFDAVTNETEITDGGRFYGEIKKAIYSHVPVDERMDCASLDELISFHTRASDDELSQLRADLREINRRIIAVENACAAGVLEQLDGLIRQAESEISVLEANPPVVVEAPQQTSDLTLAIDALLTEAEDLQARVRGAEAQKAQLNRQRAALDQALQLLRTEERRVGIALTKIQRSVDEVGVTLNVRETITVSSNFTAIEAKLDEIEAAIRHTAQVIDPTCDESAAQLLAEAEAERNRLEHELEAAASAYQSYLSGVATWRRALDKRRGTKTNPSPDSLEGLRRRRADLTTSKPALLTQLRQERRDKCKAIFEAILRLASVHERIVRPVREYIAAQELIRQHYQLAFDVTISDRGLAAKLFELVGQQGGTFSRSQPGKERLNRLVLDADFSSAEGAASFADNLLDQLIRDHRENPPTDVRLETLLKRGAAVADVYDLLYSLEYLGPAFELGLNGKPLKKLSPGERGILLLVFYLVVDLGDEPLIIDQPEGNLNNQSIVSHLVPVIMAAKEKRQIMIVTHNPNIAVVCDAEQIVHCEIAQDGTYRVVYTAGALENPQFNGLSLDLLEGTERALDARVATYDRKDGRSARSVLLPVFDWRPRATDPVARK